MSSSSTPVNVVDPYADTLLFPPIQPYNTGMLEVSDIHSLAYSVYGDPKGKPVLFIHGGPGGKTSPACARYFDPEKYQIILVDQRGCGRSTPFGNFNYNTTMDCVRDFEKIRDLLGVDKWMIFGGSWGSTLGLLYAV